MDESARRHARDFLRERTVESAAKVLTDRLRNGEEGLQKRLEYAAWLGDPAALSVTQPDVYFTWQHMVWRLTPAEVETLVLEIERRIGDVADYAGLEANVRRNLDRYFQLVDDVIPIVGTNDRLAKEQLENSVTSAVISITVGSDQEQAWSFYKFVAELLLWS